jgi:trehalose-phosphatase
MLDYDGTLAPFRLNRMEAAPSPELLELVRRAATSRRTHVAIVSGRPIDELERLIGGLPVSMVGEHGWESKPAGGEFIRVSPDAASTEALARAAAAAVSRGWEALLERKSAGIVLHTRGLPEEEVRRVERLCAEAWGAQIALAGLLMRAADGGIELRAPGRDKGTAVRELMAASPPGTLPVYVGDDETDEDAFAVVRSEGFGLLVSGVERPSQAAGRVSSVEDLTLLLEGWLELVEGGSRP